MKAQKCLPPQLVVSKALSFFHQSLLARTIGESQKPDVQCPALITGPGEGKSCAFHPAGELTNRPIYLFIAYAL